MSNVLKEGTYATVFETLSKTVSEHSEICEILCKRFEDGLLPKINL